MDHRCIFRIESGQLLDLQMYSFVSSSSTQVNRKQENRIMNLGKFEA